MRKVIAYPHSSFLCICMLLNLQNVTIFCNILKWEGSSESSRGRKDNNKQKCRDRVKSFDTKKFLLTPPFSGKDSAGGVF